MGIDGRSLYSPGYSGTFWDSQNTMLEDIERIEVIRGPGATVWGANAVNGIINIITKTAQDTQGGLVRVGMGNEGMFTSAARYGAKLGEDTFGRVSIAFDSYPSNTLLNPDITTGSKDGNDSSRTGQAGFRFEGKNSSHGEWTLQGDLLRNKEENLVFPYWLDHPPYLSSLYDSATITRGNLLARWHQELGKGRALTVQSYLDLSNYEAEKTPFEQEFKTLDLDLQYETLVGDQHNFVLGAGFRQTEIDFTSIDLLEFSDRDDSLYSAFIQDEINLVPNTLWLTLGSKYEHNDYTGSEWQPSGKLLWKPRPHHSLWASVARAVRTPTVLEQSGRVTMGTFPGGRASLQGTSGFDSEKLVAYEAGYRWQVNPTLSCDLAFFYNNYDDLYVLVLAPQPVFEPGSGWNYYAQFRNGMDGSSYGLEAALDWKAAYWLAFHLSYSWLQLNLSQADLPGALDTDLYFENLSPAHQLSLRSSISLSRSLELNLWLRYTDQIISRDSTDLIGAAELEIDGHTTFNANIIWTPTPNLELMLSGQNLFDSSTLEYGMEYLGAPTEIDRSIYGKVTWRF